MIKIVHFDHISTASNNKVRETDLFTGLFGFQIRTEWHSEEGYYGVGFDVPGPDRIGWELLVPDNDNSFLTTFLNANNGPGIHHVSMQIADAKHAIDELNNHDIEPIVTNDGIHHNVYLHPKRGGSGILFQLFEGDAWNDPALDEPIFKSNEPNLGIKRIHHIAQAINDSKMVLDKYQSLFGYHSIMQGPRKPSDEFQTNVLETQTKEIHWELLNPIGKKSFIKEFIKSKGEGAHHITFIIKNWQQAMDACAAYNIEPFGFYENKIDGAKYLECFLHPRDTAGMLVQLVWEEKEGSWI